MRTCVSNTLTKKKKITFHYVQRPSLILIITPSHMLQQFLRKDRKSELPSLIRFLSRFNQDFLNRNRKVQSTIPFQYMFSGKATTNRTHKYCRHRLDVCLFLLEDGQTSLKISPKGSCSALNLSFKFQHIFSIYFQASMRCTLNLHMIEIYGMSPHPFILN